VFFCLLTINYLWLSFSYKLVIMLLTDSVSVFHVCFNSCVLHCALNVHVELRAIRQTDVLASQKGYPWRSSLLCVVQSRFHVVLQAQSAQEIHNQALNELDVLLFTEWLGSSPKRYGCAKNWKYDSLLLLLLLLLLFVNFIQGIYSYIPGTNHDSRV
jgi:hypothetical protein